MTLPTTLIELLGWIVAAVTLGFAFIKGCSYFSREISEAQRLKLEIQKQKSKEVVDLANAHVQEIMAQVELAKHNTLTAMQVAELITQIHNIKNDLETLKKENALKDAEFVKSIDNLERLLEKLENNFKNLLMIEAGDNKNNIKTDL